MNVQALIGKPAISAAVSAVLLPQISGGRNFFFQGQRYPLYALGALLGFGSSFTSEVAHNYILPHIPGNMKYVKLESMVVSLSASGGSFVLASKLLNNNLNMQEVRNFFITGAATEVISSYLATNVLGSGTV